jgi:hypothetical protein
MVFQFASLRTVATASALVTLSRRSFAVAAAGKPDV